MIISVECRERSRKPGVQWVEEMQGKHARLTTNVLVLVAHKQFTREALRVADVYGIRCLAMNDLDSAGRERLFPDVQSLWGKGWQFNVDRVIVSVGSGWFRAQPDTELFLDDGSKCGTALDLSNAALRSGRTIGHMARNAQPEHSYVEVVWERPVDGQGRRMCVQKLEPLMLEPIDRFRVVAKCVVAVDEFPLRHAMLDERLRVAWGTGAILGRPAMVVATAGPGEEPSVSVRFVDRTDSADGGQR